MGKALIVSGLVLVLLGAVLYLGRGVPFLGRLPGDIRLDRPGFTLYLPLTSGLLVSAVLSAAVYLISRLR